MQSLAGQHGTRIPATALRGLLLLVLINPLPVDAADLAVTEMTDLDFGTVVDLNGVVTLGLNDDIVSDPFDIHVGDPVLTGEYLITGDPFATFSVIIIGSTANGLSLTSFDTDVGTPPLLNASLDGSGELLLRVGAQLIVNGSAAEPGLDQILTFTLTIDYN